MMSMYDKHLFPVVYSRRKLAINKASVFDPSVLLSPTGTASSCTGFNHICHGIKSQTVSTHTEIAYPEKLIKPLKKATAHTFLLPNHGLSTSTKLLEGRKFLKSS